MLEIPSENIINNHSVTIFSEFTNEFLHKVHTLDAAKGRLDPLTPRVADAGVADLPGLAPLGVPGGGCVPAPPSGPDGPHHPGLAAGGQQRRVPRHGPGLRC